MKKILALSILLVVALSLLYAQTPSRTVYQKLILDPASSQDMLNSYTSTVMYSIGDLPATNANYNIVAGNNTVMIPLNCNSFSLASEVGNSMAVGGVDQVSYWDNINQYFVPATNLGDFWDGDFPVSIAMPLMVNAYSSFTWPSAPPTKSRITPSSSKERSQR